MSDIKIFGIGLEKTGTTTLQHCLKYLGYSNEGCGLKLLRQIKEGDFTETFSIVDRYDSFADWPWPLIYQELDKRYPHAKFILTTRKDSSTWLNSLKKFVKQRKGSPESRKLIYGYEMPFGHEQEYIAFYKGHNQQVREYFIARSDDFLEVCWETGSDWRQLCDFLGKEIPDIAFPHANKTPSTSSYMIGKLKSYLKQAFKSG